MEKYHAALTLNSSKQPPWNYYYEEKATSLIVTLWGEPMEILKTVAEDKQKNYTILNTALGMGYDEANLRYVYQTQLRGKGQRFEEYLQQFKADISRMWS